jgi:hypothetical protein
VARLADGLDERFLLALQLAELLRDLERARQRGVVGGLEQLGRFLAQIVLGEERAGEQESGDCGEKRLGVRFLVSIRVRFEIGILVD